MSDSSGDILTGFVFALTAFFIVLKAIGLAVLVIAGLIVLVYMLVKHHK